MSKRGFHIKDETSRELLETVGQTFLTGYSYAVEARSTSEMEPRLEQIPARFRGFAYEGAAMGCAILDGLPFGGRDHVARLLAGRADRHIYTAYVGIGWAMARLPKWRWPDASALDPLLRWLVLDGYGFHQAYFRTDRYVHQRFEHVDFPWAGEHSASYGPRAIDQGIGRALWFVGGTDAARVADLIDRFAPHRRADLYSGAGLAATYAGGADEIELRVLWERAGQHQRVVTQGAAFAAEARLRGEVVQPHTELATRVFCGMTVERAARLTQDLRDNAPADGEVPAYEAWRQRIANEFVPLGGKR